MRPPILRALSGRNVGCVPSAYARFASQAGRALFLFLRVAVRFVGCGAVYANLVDPLCVVLRTPQRLIAKCGLHLLRGAPGFVQQLRRVLAPAASAAVGAPGGGGHDQQADVGWWAREWRGEYFS